MKQSPTPSAASVRRFRERLRERGLVKKEVWILPEHGPALAGIEKKMREPGVAGGPTNEPEGETAAWTLESLAGVLKGATQERVSIERMEGAEPSLRMVMHEYGDLALLLAISGEQILVETYLWPASRVRDVPAFNAMALATHKYLPLATFSLSMIADVPGYTLFGALDARSPLPSILLEIQSISEWAIAATDLYAEHLIDVAETGESS